MPNCRKLTCITLSALPSQILLTVGAYSMTALLYCAMDELLPIYSSSPVMHGGYGCLNMIALTIAV